MSRIIIGLLKYSLMTVLAVLALLPIGWMVMGSFRPHAEIFKYTSEINWKLFLPVEWTLSNYKELFSEGAGAFDRNLLNTFFIAMIVTSLALFVNSMAAFSFAKLRFPFKRTTLALFLSAMIIPLEVTLVPAYMLMRDLGWVDSYYALIVPSIVSVFGVFLMIQFFADIPRELLEAGRIDGASWLMIYWKIILPAAVPALITLGIITFLAQWDAYLWPLVVINDNAKQMIQVAIAQFSSVEMTRWGRILAASTISSLPIVIIFLFLQKYYIQSITMSGVKG
ncbi:MAG: carbohydrate transporter permease [Paenibacillus sp.]|jgi:multiple sugar transport system permease protein|nr:carbohydrate transporter permease [Paenibacillus sp.]